MLPGFILMWRHTKLPECLSIAGLWIWDCIISTNMLSPPHSAAWVTDPCNWSSLPSSHYHLILLSCPGLGEKKKSSSVYNHCSANKPTNHFHDWKTSCNGGEPLAPYSRHTGGTRHVSILQKSFMIEESKRAFLFSFFNMISCGIAIIIGKDFLHF